MKSGTNRKYKAEEIYSMEEWNTLLAKFRVPASKTKEQAWDEFEACLNVRGIVAKKRSLKYVGYSIAASIALLIGIFFWAYIRETRVECPPANMVTVALPDGSQVILNAASVIKYNKRSWNKVRSVQLDGEAFFRVKKGCRFEVVTSNGVVWVLGTTFNVFARDNRLQVYCETGKVAVAANDTVLLTPGMKAQTTTGLSLITYNAGTHESTWQQGDFWFSNAPLKDVIAEMGRQFDVDIRYNNLGDRYYTGYFNRRSLNEALRTVFYPMQLTFKIDNKVVYIIK
jgi:ferric-dicitrate binding protein FerR (iron transport regulator)